MEPSPSDSPPPPTPPKQGMPTWAIVLIVLIAVGCGGVLVCSGAVVTVARIVPRMQETQRRITCMNNLSQLGQNYLVQSQINRRVAQAQGGSALWVAYRKNLTGLRIGDERVLLCPGDPLATPLETASASHLYDDVDLARVPRSMCSYAGRDFEKFPIDRTSHGKEPIGACLSHKGGAVVVFVGGDVQFVPLLELGLASDEEKSVGPDSKSPMPRVLRYGDGSVR